MGFGPCKAEQILKGMKLQVKEAQKGKAYRKSVSEKPTVNLLVGHTVINILPGKNLLHIFHCTIYIYIYIFIYIYVYIYIYISIYIYIYVYVYVYILYIYILYIYIYIYFEHFEHFG